MNECGSCKAILLYSVFSQGLEIAHKHSLIFYSNFSLGVLLGMFVKYFFENIIFPFIDSWSTGWLIDILID